ncbi:hypothetical protein NQ317_010714 [Molorchus minor]|uniref:Uncharacterized protein n=1 Tax=Molorchus minor TaxID=1323400 RepID=A0ABQ9K5R2_9CUCU|nr:hypothetical protein NQ317_010714 [Molorchus minor]
MEGRRQAAPMDQDRRWGLGKKWNDGRKKTTATTIGKCSNGRKKTAGDINGPRPTVEIRQEEGKWKKEDCERHRWTKTDSGDLVRRGVMEEDDGKHRRVKTDMNRRKEDRREERRGIWKIIA